MKALRSSSSHTLHEMLRHQLATSERQQSVAIGDDSYELITLADMEAATQKTSALLGRVGLAARIPDMCPHFGVVWPAAIALAEATREYLQQRPRGIRALELGCGLALPSLVASRCGVEQVTATDRHPLVPYFLARNCAANAVRRVYYQALDWRRPRSLIPQMDLILGSDLLYEPWQPGYLASTISQHLSATGVALIADPGRKLVDTFLSQAEAQGLSCTEMQLRTAGATPASSADVLILEIRQR